MKANQMIGLATVVILGLFAIGCGSEEAAQQSASSETDLQAKADALAQQNIIVDTHVDIPYRMTEYFEDISGRTELGDFDYVRALEGGLDAPFMSIYVASEFQETGGAKAEAERLIDMVEKFTTDWPDQFAMATSVSDVESLFGSGKIALAMGMENGAPVEDNLENLAHFHQRGIRYITLTHGKANQICDSSYDPERKWNGLSPFGRDVVAEVGVLVPEQKLEGAVDVVVAVVPVPVAGRVGRVRHRGLELGLRRRSTHLRDQIGLRDRAVVVRPVAPPADGGRVDARNGRVAGGQVAREALGGVVDDVVHQAPEVERLTGVRQGPEPVLKKLDPRDHRRCATRLDEVHDPGRATVDLHLADFDGEVDLRVPPRHGRGRHHVLERDRVGVEQSDLLGGSEAVVHQVEVNGVSAHLRHPVGAKKLAGRDVLLNVGRVLGPLELSKVLEGRGHKILRL